MKFGYSSSFFHQLRNRVPVGEQKVRCLQRIECHLSRKVAAIQKENAKYVDGRGMGRAVRRRLNLPIIIHPDGSRFYG